MAIKICHASIDERGKIKGGKAGDQTGKEVCTRSWYNKPWDFSMRYPDENIAKKAAAAAVKLANSNLVGYDQNQRNTLYQELKKNNWNVDAYIASGVKTETDCSAFVYACYCLFIPSMRSDTNAPATSWMLSAYQRFGFKILKGNTYTATESNMKVGDILVKAGSHTVIISECQSGSKVLTPISGKPIYSAIANTAMKVRTAPNLSGDTLGTITKGTKVAVYEICENNWLKIDYNGFIAYTSNASNYYTLSSLKNNNNCYTVSVTAGGLKGRTGPGTSYPYTVVYPKASIHTIVEERGNWGKTLDGTWIALNYTKRGN